MPALHFMPPMSYPPTPGGPCLYKKLPEIGGSLPPWLSPYCRLPDRHKVDSMLQFGDEVEFTIRSIYTKRRTDGQTRPERGNHLGVVVYDERVPDTPLFYVPRYGYLYHPMTTTVRRIFRGDTLLTRTNASRRIPRPPSPWPFYDPLSPGYAYPTPSQIVLRVGDVVEYTAHLHGRDAEVRGVMVTPLTMTFNEITRPRPGVPGPRPRELNTVSVATNPITRVWRDGVLLAQVTTMAWPRQFCTPYVDPTNFRGYPTTPIATPDRKTPRRRPIHLHTYEGKAAERKAVRDAYWNSLTRDELEALIGPKYAARRMPDGSFNVPLTVRSLHPQATSARLPERIRKRRAAERAAAKAQVEKTPAPSAPPSESP